MMSLRYKLQMQSQSIEQLYPLTTNRRAQNRWHERDYCCWVESRRSEKPGHSLHNPDNSDGLSATFEIRPVQNSLRPSNRRRPLYLPASWENHASAEETPCVAMQISFLPHKGWHQPTMLQYSKPPYLHPSALSSKKPPYV